MNIDRILYINLKERTERNLSVINCLKQSNLPFTRISGVIANNYLNYDVINIIKYGSLRHKGVIGCFLAHKNCYEFILNDLYEDKNYLIIEDDVIFNKNLFNQLKNIDMPDGDILFINSCCLYPTSPKPDINYLNNNIYYIYTQYPTFNGAHAYIINKNTAKKILQKIETISIFEELDIFLFKNFKCYSLVSPFLKINDDFPSDRWPDIEHNKYRQNFKKVIYI